MSKNKISIITVNFNNREGLAKTIASVKEQDFTDYEYLVIDGGSSDGSSEIIAANTDIISYWVSEKDRGIYHAMNKGIAKANGEYIHFLNSGDSFCSSRSLSEFMLQQPVADIVYADYKDALNGIVYKMPAQLSFRFFYKQSLNHQATVIRRSLFEEFELYNEESLIIADWEFFIKAIVLKGASTQYISLPFIFFDFTDSMSNKPENLEKIVERRHLVLQQYFPLITRDMKYIDAVESSATFKLLQKITRIKSFFFK